MTDLRALGLLVFSSLSITAITSAQSAPHLRLSDQEFAATLASSCSHHPIASAADLQLERDLQATLSTDRDTPTGKYLDLACLRTHLYLNKVIARSGFQMHLGDGWYLGALRALEFVLHAPLRDSAVDPANIRTTADLYGALLLADHRAPAWDKLSATFREIRKRTPNAEMAMRACAASAFAARAFEESEACARTSVTHAADPVWQSLQLGRIAHSRGDSAAVTRHLDDALSSAARTDEWSPFEWHLAWFLTPDEQLEWDDLPSDGRSQWIKSLLATRDLRDGRPVGHRWYAHMERLAAADSQFRLQVPRTELQRFERTAAPETDVVSDWVASYWEPGLAPARPYREFVRTHPEYDDRAHVLMRFGFPERRIHWTSRDTVPARPEMTAIELRAIANSVNTREAWLYRLPAGDLLLNFESERFDGTNDANRLVAGVLGSYFCDIDSFRCALSMRSAGGMAPLSPEQLQRVRVQDSSMIASATSTDYIGTPGRNAIDVVGSAHRVFSLGTGRSLVLVTYAVRARDLNTSDLADGRKSADFSVLVNRLTANAAASRVDTVLRHLRMPAKLDADNFVTGQLLLDGEQPPLTSWSISVLQGDSAQGRTSGVAPARNETGGLTISDIVIGARSQGQMVRLDGATEVVLGPLGAFNRNEELELYWQVRSPASSADMTTTIRIFEGNAAVPALSLAFSGTASAGLTEHQRTIDVATSRLPAGIYRLEVTVADAVSGGKASASAPLLLR